MKVGQGLVTIDIARRAVPVRILIASSGRLLTVLVGRHGLRVRSLIVTSLSFLFDFLLFGWCDGCVLLWRRDRPLQELVVVVNAEVEKNSFSIDFFKKIAQLTYRNTERQGHRAVQEAEIVVKEMHLERTR